MTVHARFLGGPCDGHEREIERSTPEFRLLGPPQPGKMWVDESVYKRAWWARNSGGDMWVEYVYDEVASATTTEGD